MNRARLLDFPGHEHHFEWLPGDDDAVDEAALALRALGALQALAGVVQPLAADLSLQCTDPQTGYAIGGTRPALAFHHLQAADLPAGLHCTPAFAGSVCSRAGPFDGAALQSWILSALADAECPAGTTVGWDSLRFDATRARLGHVENSADAAMRLDRAGAEVAAVPLRHDGDDAWVAGPVSDFPDQPPIALALSNEGGALRLVVAVHWSPWNDDMSGRAALAEACAQLSAAGWAAADD